MIKQRQSILHAVKKGTECGGNVPKWLFLLDKYIVNDSSERKKLYRIFLMEISESNETDSSRIFSFGDSRNDRRLDYIFVFIIEINFRVDFFCCYFAREL